ncbi:MAG: HD domain-containing protein [Thermodesulfobacteriota bacterium]
MVEEQLVAIKKGLEEREERFFSSHATLSSTGIRRHSESREGHRTSFAVDTDRVLHSRAYTRYIDKTQVFYLVENDHITHRVLHVQLVSKIARTLARVFALNEDLAEAIALGHDIGHPPFGHDGEAILDDLSRDFGLVSFQHNLQSIRFLEHLENHGRGCNLTVQVLDGILCHDGEVHNRKISPKGEVSFAEFDRKITTKSNDKAAKLRPMTIEGCLVRLADTLSYIGRDIEDAIELKLISRHDIPEHCQKVLGRTNGTIVHRLVADLIGNGCQGEIGFSEQVSEALQELKAFNYKFIYLNKAIKPDTTKMKDCFTSLFNKYVDEINREDHGSVVYTRLMKFMDKGYMHDTPPATIAVDFIAGMTDDYFLREASLIGCQIPKII